MHACKLIDTIYIGRLGIFYGNKSTVTLQSFSTSLSMSAGLSENIVVTMKSVASTIEGGAQKQQLLDVECMNVFFEAPRIEITFQ